MFPHEPRAGRPSRRFRLTRVADRPECRTDGWIRSGLGSKDEETPTLMARIAATAGVLLMMMASGCASVEHRPTIADRVVPCPCSIEELEQLGRQRPGIVIDRDGDRTTRRFHPGAMAVYRIFDPQTDPVAGNQCGYDASGRLITGGPAAGTPDYISPERSRLGHAIRDVAPFLWLGWESYHDRGWAPVSSGDCLSNGEAHPIPQGSATSTRSRPPDLAR